MARHTLDEYRVAVEGHTGLTGVEILVLDPLEEGPRKEVISVLMGTTELAQFADVGNLAKVPQKLPSALHADAPHFQKRLQILGMAQQAAGIDELLQRSTNFRESLEQALLEPPMPEDPLAHQREFRRRVEELVWNSNPLLIAQIEAAMQKG